MDSAQRFPHRGPGGVLNVDLRVRGAMDALPTEKNVLSRVGIPDLAASARTPWLHSQGKRQRLQRPERPRATDGAPTSEEWLAPLLFEQPVRRLAPGDETQA